MIQIARVSALPGTLAANTIYLVADGATGLQVVVTGATAEVVKSTLTTAQIQSMISSSIASDAGAIPQYVADIAARDALTLTKNSMVLVGDATGDETVGAGAALYFYDQAADNFIKVAEYESMDLVIPNMDILSDLSDIGGKLGYKGALVSNVEHTASEW